MRHIPALDGLRGFAILLVMLHHQTLFEDGSWSVLMDLGWVALDLFLILSGFLITGILLDTKGRPRYFRNFYARRTLRIFPLYYALLLVAFVALPRVPLPEAQAAKVAALEGSAWLYVLYLQNFAMVFADGFPHAVLGVTWSLAIEEQFYIVWPAVVLLLSRRRLLFVCAALFAGAPVLRAALALNGSGWIAPYILTPCRMDAIAMGAVLAMAARTTRGLGALVPAARIAIAVGIAGVFATALAGGGTGFKRLGMHTVGFTFVSLLLGGWMLLAVSAAPESRHARFLSCRFLAVFGRFSYALYLVHMPCRVFVQERLFWPTGYLGQAAFYVVATLPALGLAWLSWHLFEKRFLALKRYF